MDINPMCKICQAQKEDTSHLFLYCPYAQDICRCLGISPLLYGFTDLKEAFDIRRKGLDRDQLELWIISLWDLWHQRNNILFENRSDNRRKWEILPQFSWIISKLQEQGSFSSLYSFLLHQLPDDQAFQRPPPECVGSVSNGTVESYVWFVIWLVALVYKPSLIYFLTFEWGLPCFVNV